MKPSSCPYGPNMCQNDPACWTYPVYDHGPVSLRGLSLLDCLAYAKACEARWLELERQLAELRQRHG